jgi:hypothetical protein
MLVHVLLVWLKVRSKYVFAGRMKVRDLALIPTMKLAGAAAKYVAICCHVASTHVNDPAMRASVVAVRSKSMRNATVAKSSGRCRVLSRKKRRRVTNGSVSSIVGVSATSSTIVENTAATSCVTHRKRDYRTVLDRLTLSHTAHAARRSYKTYKWSLVAPAKIPFRAANNNAGKHYLAVTLARRPATQEMTACHA